MLFFFSGFAPRSCRQSDCTALHLWASHNVDHGRKQELLATRSALTTRVLCATLQMQESLVITVRCCQACTLLCTCAWRRFLKFAQGRWLELLAGRDFWHQGCVHLHSWQELSVIVSRVPQLCASLSIGSTLGISSKQSVSILSNPDVTCRPMQTGCLALHFNSRIGADDPEVADECKFGPCAFTSISD